jgi:hypothetical protein
MKIRSVLAETPSEPIVALSYETSVIKAVYSFPDHHCDHYEGQVAQPPSNLPAVKAEITTKRFSRALLFAAADSYDP